MPDAPSPKRWETFLALILLLLLGGGFFALLNFFFGAISVVLMVMVAATAVGYLHYVLWGYAFSQKTAGERQEEQLRQRHEAQEYEQDPF